MLQSENEKDLFARYLEICNEAIEANKDRFPFKEIISAAQLEKQADNVEVHIIDDEPAASYVIHLRDNEVVGESASNCENCNCKGQWRVSKSYLKDVISNPDAYINNPAKIDWEWMFPNKGN